MTINPRAILSQALLKAAAKEKEEWVEVHGFMDQMGRDYWAKKILNPSDVTYPCKSKVVLKGSVEDR